MELPIFRSRGISYRFQSGNSNIGITLGEKIYFEPGDIDFEDSSITGLIANRLISYFEYSVNQFGIIDTYNFHVNLLSDYSGCYSGLTEAQKHIIDEIPHIFSPSFRNYTIGFRMDGMRVKGITYYFYPTVKKTNRYGIAGQINTQEIEYECDRFSQYVNVQDEAANTIHDFASSANKFKGISITVAGTEIVDYKLYGRFDPDKIESLLVKKGISSSQIPHQYGFPVLAALRISAKAVSGYNLYYLQ